MISYDKYERGRQHLNGGHQRITYQKKYLPYGLPKVNQWVGVDHATRIHLLNSPPMTSSVEKNKMIVKMMMMMMQTIMRAEKQFLTCLSNASIKCRSLTRKKLRRDT